MTDAPSDKTQALLEGILETVLHIQDRVAAVEQRLDAIDAAQACVADIAPNLETLLAYVIEAHGETQSHAKCLADIGARTHAAVCGRPEPLPVDVLTNPVMERFLLKFPDGLPTQDDRAIDAWRATAAELAVIELTTALERQYRVSATDTDATLALRFQMAAVSRAELDSRTAPAPAAPTQIERPALTADSRSNETRRLAQLWQGSRANICAEPELVSLMVVLEQHSKTNGLEVSDVIASVARALETGEWPNSRFLPAPSSPALAMSADLDTHR